MLPHPDEQHVFCEQRIKESACGSTDSTNFILPENGILGLVVGAKETLY
jgi:hypothetical protein